VIEIKGIKGAIFDMDGTIIDSMGIWEDIDIEFLGKRGIDTPEDLAEKIKHMSFHDSAIYFKESFGLTEEVDEIIKEWDKMAYHYYANIIELKPGVREYLKELRDRDIKMGLATTSSRRHTEAVLKRNDIFYYFDAISTGDEIKKDKSSPDIFIETCEKLDLKPYECVVFEDIYVAVLSAKKAGMKVVGVYDKYSGHQKSAIKNEADLYIMDFNELI
jgi:HAD superfamily hydrolase (TIGR01509 family)